MRGRHAIAYLSLLTSHLSLLLLLRISRRKRHPVSELPIETDLEGVLPGPGEGHVEDQHGTGFDIHDSRRWLTELHGAFAAQELAPTVIDEADSDGVDPDLGAPAPDPEHQVGAGVHRRKIREPHVLEHAQHAQLALLIDQGVVGNDGEIEMQLRRPG
jgi:hypothetical protein